MSKKRKKQKGGRPSKNTANAKLLKDRVRGVFAQHLGERFSYRQLIKKLGLRDKKSKDMLKDILFSMESNDKIKKAPDGRNFLQLHLVYHTCQPSIRYASMAYLCHAFVAVLCAK